MIPESQEKSLPCKNPHVWGCRERGNQIEKAEKEEKAEWISEKLLKFNEPRKQIRAIKSKPDKATKLR